MTMAKPGLIQAFDGVDDLLFEDCELADNGYHYPPPEDNGMGGGMGGGMFGRRLTDELSDEEQRLLSTPHGQRLLHAHSAPGRRLQSPGGGDDDNNDTSVSPTMYGLMVLGSGDVKMRRTVFHDNYCFAVVHIGGVSSDACAARARFLAHALRVLLC